MKKQTVKLSASNNSNAGSANKKEIDEEKAIKYLMEVAVVGEKAGRHAIKGERAKLKALGILKDKRTKTNKENMLDAKSYRLDKSKHSSSKRISHIKNKKGHNRSVKA